VNQERLDSLQKNGNVAVLLETELSD